MSNKRQKFAVNVERRHWDVDAYAAVAAQREAEEDVSKQTPNQTKAPLQARAQSIDVSSQIGKIERGAGGFPCTLCNCVVKDHRTYLDHVNGKAHQAKLGRSMRTEKVGSDSVRDKLAALQSSNTLPKTSKVVIGVKRKSTDTNQQSIIPPPGSSSHPKALSETQHDTNDQSNDTSNDVSSASVSANADATAADAETDAMAAMGFDFNSFGKGKKR